MIGRNRRSLEAVVQDHMVLSQIRENLGAWFEKHGFDVTGKLDDEYYVTLEELQRANEVVLREGGVDHDVGFCTFCCMVSAKTHIGRRLRSPNTRSLGVCLGHLQRLSAASHLDWPELRSVYLDLFQQSDPRMRVPTPRGTRLTQAAAQRVDAVYARFTARRTEIARRRDERLLRRAAAAADAAARRQEGRRCLHAKKLLRDARVEQERCRWRFHMSFTVGVFVVTWVADTRRRTMEFFCVRLCVFRTKCSILWVGVAHVCRRTRVVCQLCPWSGVCVYACRVCQSLLFLRVLSFSVGDTTAEM